MYSGVKGGDYWIVLGRCGDAAKSKKRDLRSALVGDSLHSLSLRWNVVVLILWGRWLQIIVMLVVLKWASGLYLVLWMSSASLLALGDMTPIVGSVTVLSRRSDEVRISSFPVTTIMLLIARLILDSIREDIRMA